MPIAPDRTRVESIFIRHRNTLMVRANFTDIFMDHYLHLADHDLKYAADLDHKLKELLVVLTLHAVARPWSEVHAWTVNLRAPRVNFFATASSTHENVVGRVFTEDVREPPQNLLYTQVTDGESGPRLSTVALATDNPFDWLSHYYTQSEQRPGKIFELPDETFVLLAAQPDYDQEWFESLTAETVAAFAETEDLSPLENRAFHFFCGCSRERIMPALAVWQDKLDELFGDDEQVSVQCPRCARKYAITREDFAQED